MHVSFIGYPGVSDGSIVTFLTMIGGGQKGYREVTQEVSQAFEEIRSFSSSTVQSNQHTIGVDVSVAGPLRGLFNLGADFSYTGDFMTTSTQESSYASTSRWEQAMTQSYVVSYNSKISLFFLFWVARLKMASTTLSWRR